MTGNASHSPETDKERPNEVITKMQLALSPEIYARALLICQRRNCTLETVVEDLIERFLPPARPDEKKPAKPTSVPVRTEAETDTAGKRWIPNPRSKKRRLG